MDAMRGDATLFTRDDEVEAQWSIIDPILEAWGQQHGPLPQYPAGSHGPEEAELHPRGRAPVANDLERPRGHLAWRASGPSRTPPRPT